MAEMSLIATARNGFVTKSASTGLSIPSPYGSGGWFGVIREGFSGAWQRNIEVESRENLLHFSGIYAPMTLVAGDISKLRVKLVRETIDGVWEEFDSPAFSPVLRKPNAWQTYIQFFEQWILTKLIHGNTYIYKERDARNVVVAMYVLDSRRVQPLVSDDGGVYYRLSRDDLSQIEDGLTVPASEIIHDRMNCFYHPLVGISPISACGASATQGIRIQNNSAKFFENMSRPSGQLTAPARIDDETAARLKREFESNFGGSNIGRLFVSGNGLKYEPMMIPAHEAQLIEQLRWTIEDSARCLHVPLYKLGIGAPTVGNMAVLNQDYYSQCLQKLIEDAEALLNDGLGLSALGFAAEFDLDGLLRMDPVSRADAAEKRIRAGISAPNEERLKENMPPVDGGESPMIQQQNYSLGALAKRDAKPDPFASGAPAVTAQPTAPMLQAPDAAKEDEAFATFMSTIQKAFDDA